MINETIIRIMQGDLQKDCRRMAKWMILNSVASAVNLHA